MVLKQAQYNDFEAYTNGLINCYYETLHLIPNSTSTALSKYHEVDMATCYYLH